MANDDSNALLASVVPVSKMRGDDKEDSRLLTQMHREACRYITSFKWCGRIKEEYFGFGIGGIVAVFLFEIENLTCPADSYLWVIVGDLPSAYLVIDDAPDPKEAISVYIDLTQEWVDAVLSGKATDNCFPVERGIDPSLSKTKLAEMLQPRLDYLRTAVLPRM